MSQTVPSGHLEPEAIGGLQQHFVQQLEGLNRLQNIINERDINNSVPIPYTVLWIRIRVPK
jgi:hypothetical protein